MKKQPAASALHVCCVTVTLWRQTVRQTDVNAETERAEPTCNV